MKASAFQCCPLVVPRKYASTPLHASLILLTNVLRIILHCLGPTSLEIWTSPLYTLQGQSIIEESFNVSKACYFDSQGRSQTTWRDVLRYVQSSLHLCLTGALEIHYIHQYQALPVEEGDAIFWKRAQGICDVMKTMGTKSHWTLMPMALKYVVSFSLLHLFHEDFIFLFSELHPNRRIVVWWLLCWKTETRLEWRLYDRCNVVLYFSDSVHLWRNILVVCPAAPSPRFCWAIVIPTPIFKLPHSTWIDIFDDLYINHVYLCWGDMFPLTYIPAQMHSFSVLVCCPCTFPSISVAWHRRKVVLWHVLYIPRIVSSHLSFLSHCKSTTQF